MSFSAGKYWGMRRMADAQGRFKMTAVDQRPPIKNPIKAKRGTAEAPWEDVAGFKEMLIEELQGESSAMLLDPHFAIRAASLNSSRLAVSSSRSRTPFSVKLRRVGYPPRSTTGRWRRSSVSAVMP
jgi:tagatose-1,6-bisphosphate aldolase